LPLTRTDAPEFSEDHEGSESGSEDEDDEKVAHADLGAIKAGMMEECKLVLVVNDSLKMTKGKIAAQCSHATLACYKTLQQQNPAVRCAEQLTLTG
jgi:PTH2 family peptidyl-tRNA hydrolase